MVAPRTSSATGSIRRGRSTAVWPFIARVALWSTLMHAGSWCEGYTSGARIRPVLQPSVLGHRGAPVAQGAAGTTAEAEADETVDQVNTTAAAGLSREEFVLKAKAAVQDLLPRLETDEDFDRLGRLIGALRSTYIPIQTVGFLNFGTQGDWRFAYTTSPLGTVSPTLRLRQVSQCITPDENREQQGLFSTTVIWDLVDEQCTGRFEILSNYTLNRRGEFEHSFREYILEPMVGSPTDPVSLVGKIERALPKELFEPDKLNMRVLYLDTDLRIMEVMGPSAPGPVQQIFERPRDGEWN